MTFSHENEAQILSTKSQILNNIESRNSNDQNRLALDFEFGDF